MSSSSRSRFAAAVIAVLSAIIWGVAPSQAAAVDAPESCSYFTRGLETDDGSVIAAGDGCLVKFDPAGNLVLGFGQEGVASIPPLGINHHVMDLLDMPDGYLVATMDAFFKFTETGRLDPTFGGTGMKEADQIVPFTNVVYDAEPGPGGSFFFTGIQRPGGPGGHSIGKVAPDGNLDPTWSGDGMFHGSLEAEAVDDFHFQKLHLDPDGRLLVAGESWGTHRDASMIRIMAGGNLDPGFGGDGQANSPPRPCPSSGCGLDLQNIEVGGNGEIRILGASSVTIYRGPPSYTTLWADFDENGNLLAGAPANFPSGGVAFATLPDGDLAVSGEIGRRIQLDGSRVPLAGKPIDRSKLAPGGFDTSHVSYNPVTGNVLTVGYLTGEAPDDHEPAVAKTDPDTGSAIEGFGTGGVAMVVPGVCASGPAPPLEGYGPWPRCSIKVPNARVDVSLGRARSKTPSLRAEIHVRTPDLYPLFVGQYVTMKLPAKLMFRKKALKRVRVEPSVAVEGEFTVVRKPRKIGIRYLPTEHYWDEEYEDVPLNAPLSISIFAPSGTLKRQHVRRLDGWKLNFITSVGLQRETVNPWWQGNSRVFKTTVKVPGKRR